jgi:ketosteroid isomerase-like protein
MIPAMSREHVETVRRLFGYWERGEWPASAELFDPDFEAVFSATAFPDPGTYRGARATLDAWTRWLDAWEEFNLELEDAIATDDGVVVLNRLRGRGKASGAAVDAEVGCIFDFNDGKIVRMVFCDRQRALEAAQPREEPRT